MVCIAAFIILCVIGLFVAFLSIFKRDLGKRYWAVFSKAWGCVGKKVRLQKCETNFKDDVKNSMLKKVVLKHPKWVKPISVVVEIIAVVIVVVAVWSIIEVTKALLALWALGSCNVSKPSACTLSSATCSVDEETPKNPVEGVGRWFSEWGEIFQAIPDRLRNWNAEDYLVQPTVYARTDTATPDSKLPYAVDVVDPGCVACMQSYRNQLRSGFFTKYNTELLVYPIRLPDGSYKFKNSELIARYFYTAALYDPLISSRMIKRLFTESNADGVNYQSAFNEEYDAATAERVLQEWLRDFGCTPAQIAEVKTRLYSDQVNQILGHVSDLVNTNIRAKGIPLSIYNGKIHLGVYEAPNE